MGLMRVNRPISSYSYEVNNINNNKNGNGLGRAREPQSVLDLILTSEIKN